MQKVKIIHQNNHALPEYATEGASGMDVRASIENPIIIKPLERILVPTGIFIQLPEGYEAQIRPRSGLAYKNGITVLNSPGTIDSDYTGEIKILLINLSKEDFIIENGERIAQMIIAPYTKIEWEKVEVLTTTQRGEGGFGSTGKK
ncbi:MAG: dUTP diphosphatase [Cytophagales bacterium]|nr:MAG: dUTP diphosphatase [Cytophagales bacterium]